MKLAFRGLRAGLPDEGAEVAGELVELPSEGLSPSRSCTGKLVSHNRLKGQWLLDPPGLGGEGNPILVEGEPYQIGSTFEMTRPPVESLP